MSGRKKRRRLRIRRKRKGERLAESVADGVANQVVAEAGGCVVEAVGSAVALAALLTVPAYFLLR